MYFYFSVNECDANCTLNVDFNHSYTQRITQPETGDDFCPVDLQVGVNWPSHGSTAPFLAGKRLNFYRDIVQLGTRIQEACKATDVMMLVQTQADKDAEEKERDVAGEVELLRKIVASGPIAHMRVGSLRTMSEYTKIKFPLGHHTVSIGKKVYEVHHYDDGRIILERTI